MDKGREGDVSARLGTFRETTAKPVYEKPCYSRRCHAKVKRAFTTTLGDKNTEKYLN